MSATGELLEIRGLARDFAAAELRPHTEKWDAERTIGDTTIAKIAELGFFGMLVPEAQGGMGFELPTVLAALEEIAWGEPAVALLVSEHIVASDLIARHGGAAHADLLGRLAAGDAIACCALSDDGTVRATRAGDGWTLRGTRRWVTNAARADVAIVAADDDEGPALFVVPRDGGYAIEGSAGTMGLRPVPVNTIALEGDALSAEARLSWRGADAHDALQPVAALSAAAIAVAVSRAALDHAVGYAAQREQFGRPLRSFEGIQIKLADMATRVAGAQALLDRAAAQPQDDAAVAMAKLAAGTCAMHVTTDAVQIFGGYGYMRDYPVEKLMRDAKAMEILHGTNEMQRLRIAAALYAD